MKSKWKTQYKDIENSSKFHNKVKEIFRKDSFFKHLKCYQEIPVSELIPDYQNNQHRFDWYIEELSAVVELHGMQHYKQTNFGNIGYDEAASNFIAMKQRDYAKKDAALNHGFFYIEIPYTCAKNLTPSKLKNIILKEIV